MASTLYVTSGGDMLDEICWRHYGRQSVAVETVLEANRGLAQLGSVYPAGVPIALPDIAPTSVAGPVRLWD